MPQFRDFLARFRPAGAPGAASRVGVAVDRARESSAELEPVLALLAATHAECERMVSGARQQARQIAEEAREQSAVIGAEAGRRAEAVRAAAAAEVMAAARAQAAMTARDAERAAQRPHHAAEQRIDELVSAAADLVRRLPEEGRLP